MNVLIVEDDAGVLRLLQQATSEAGYVVQTSTNGELALETARNTPFDLILLDVMLPKMDGLAVCRALRASQVMTPILMITARDTLEDKVAGLDQGADDYLVKPFKVAELLARMRALLRRGSSTAAVLTVADLSLDPSLRHATRAGKNIPLSATEYRLLEYMMRNAGRVLTRSMILEHVWQYDFGGKDNVLEVYISYIRGKVDRAHKVPLIHTVRGVGYSLSVQSPNL